MTKRTYRASLVVEFSFRSEGDAASIEQALQQVEERLQRVLDRHAKNGRPVVGADFDTAEEEVVR